MPAILLGPSFIHRLLPKNMGGGSVIIVGAGVSGLYAAKVLRDAGITVTILEASGLHGGRVRSITDFADFPIEAGAEYVQGKENAAGDPPSFLWSSINAYNPDLLLNTGGYKESIALTSTTYELSPPYWDDELEFAWNFFSTYDGYTGDDILMSDYLFNTYGIDESHPYWHIYENWIGAEFGTTIKRLGLKSLNLQEGLWLVGDKNYMLDGAFHEILDEVFFNDIVPSIELNKQVTNVDYSGTGVVVNCNDGSTYTADKILITVPVSILKENVIAFNPALPASKTAAIENIGMGTGMKILLKFTEQFWDDDNLWFTYFNYAQSGWCPGLPKTFGTNNVITCYIMGEKGEYLSSLGTAAVDVILAELDLFYDGAASAKFVDSRIIDWIKEPFIKGVYSYPTPGTFESEAVSKRLDLAEPIDCKVFFAGEATSNNHPATVHGALETGARAALEILECPGTIVIDTQSTPMQVEIILAENEVLFNISSGVAANDFEIWMCTSNGVSVKSFYSGQLLNGTHSLKYTLPEVAAGIYLFNVKVQGKAVSRKFYIK